MTREEAEAALDKARIALDEALRAHREAEVAYNKALSEDVDGLLAGPLAGLGAVYEDSSIGGHPRFLVLNGAVRLTYYGQDGRDGIPWFADTTNPWLIRVGKGTSPREALMGLRQYAAFYQEHNAVLLNALTALLVEPS